MIFESEVIKYLEQFSVKASKIAESSPLWQDSCHYLKFNQLGR